MKNNSIRKSTLKQVKLDYLMDLFNVVHLWMDISKKNEQIHSNASSVRRIVDVSHAKVSGEYLLFVGLIQPRQTE